MTDRNEPRATRGGDARGGALHASSARERRARRRYSGREQLAAYAFLAPSVVSGIVFVLIPVAVGLGLAFFEWDFISAPKFVGFENWNTLLSNREALASIRITLLLVVLAIPLTTSLGMVLALLVNDLPVGKVVFRSVFFAPAVTSLVAISIVWRIMFATETGLLNYLLSFAGVQPVRWLSNPSSAIAAVIIMSVWHSAGYNMLIFFAGLQGIDDTFYEAARIDGGSPWAIFWRITLPLLSPQTFFVVVTSIISSLQAFEAVYLLTGGGPGYATTTLVYFIINAAFRGFDVGLAAAVSIVLFLLIFTVTMIQWRFQRRWVHYG